MIYSDQLKRKIELPETPKRIVSLVPSQTELLVDLGLHEQISGITGFCVHPAGLRKEKTIVGGPKNVNFKRIQALNPDFIFCNKEENTPGLIEKLEKIAPVWISDIYTITDCIEMIASIGEIFNKKSKAAEIIERISEKKRELQIFIKDKPVQRVLYFIWKDPYMAAGRNTFINEMLRLNKLENAIENPDSRYPEISLKNLPPTDAILLSTEPYSFTEIHAEAVAKQTGLPVYIVDGEFFSWYGSRLSQAFDYFKTLPV